MPVTDVDVKDALGATRNISLPATKPVSIASAQVASGAFASGSIGSGAIASGAIASGAVAAGAIAAGAAVDGSDLTQGVTTGAKVVTDASGTIQQYLRGLVTFFANALGAGTAAAAIRHTLASDDPAVATLGATTGAAVITDANGTIQQYLRGLIKQWVAGTLVVGTGSNIMGRVGLDQTTPGTTNAVAPISGQAGVAGGAGTLGATTQRTVRGGCATGTKSNVSGSASSVTVLASNTARQGASVYNDSSSILYLDLSGGTASSTSFSVLMQPNAFYEVPFKYNGAITGIWATATGTARVTEFA